MQKRTRKAASPPKMPVKFNAIVGNIVSTLRREAKLSQGELAARLQVPQSALSRLEAGSVPITVEQLLRVSIALKVPTAKIMEESEKTADRLRANGFIIIARKEETSPAAAAIAGAALGAILTILGNDSEE